MFRRRLRIRPCRARRTVAALAVLLTLSLGIARPAPADPEIRFSPGFLVLGTADSDFLRTGDDEWDTFVTYGLELPLTIRGPRWEGELRYRPSYRQRDGSRGFDGLDHRASLELTGDLSPRTRMALRGRFAYTPEIYGLSPGEVAVPAAVDQLHGTFSATIDHDLSATDVLHVGGTYATVLFPDGGFVDEQRFGGQVGYGRRLTPRLEVLATGRAVLFDFLDLGNAVSLGPSAGLRYRLSPRTTLSLEGGAALLTGDLESSGVAVDVDVWEPTFRASLGHAVERVTVGLAASRSFEISGGLGQPSRRTTVSGSVGYGAPRFELDATAGYAVNEIVLGDDGRSLLEAVFADRFALRDVDRFETVTAGLDARMRITRWASLVASWDFAHQLPTGGADAFGFDTQRAALGVSLQANAPPLEGSGR